MSGLLRPLVLVRRIDVFKHASDALEGFEDAEEFARGRAAEMDPRETPLKVWQMSQKLSDPRERERCRVPVYFNDGLQTLLDESVGYV